VWGSPLPRPLKEGSAAFLRRQRFSFVFSLLGDLFQAAQRRFLDPPRQPPDGFFEAFAKPGFFGCPFFSPCTFSPSLRTPDFGQRIETAPP